MQHSIDWNSTHPLHISPSWNAFLPFYQDCSYAYTISQIPVSYGTVWFALKVSNLFSNQIPMIPVSAKYVSLPDMSDICPMFTMQFYNGLHSIVRQMSDVSLPHFIYTVILYLLSTVYQMLYVCVEMYIFKRCLIFMGSSCTTWSINGHIIRLFVVYVVDKSSMICGPISITCF